MKNKKLLPRTINGNLRRGVSIMKRYIVFLRGINISGKNKVPMAELKQNFEKLDYTEDKT